MKNARLLAVLLVLALAMPLSAQIEGDQLGIHDMTPTGNRGAPAVYGTIGSACLYCHAPHGAGSPAPLWNQQLSIQTYTTYTSTTYHQTGVQPVLGNSSKLCLSCHDGSVAPGQTYAWGTLPMSGPGMSEKSKFGTNMATSHPFSMQTPLRDAPEINALLFAAPPKTADPLDKVKLINGSVECTSCHDPHFQGIDRVVPMFLVRDSANSQLCLSCHDPTRTVTGQVNYLGGWAVSAHATSTITAGNNPYIGGYGTVAQTGCNGCHMPHNAAGPARLLRAPDEQACAACHSGTTNAQGAKNLSAEFAKTAHPFASPNNLHDRAESAILNNNRHATCADCHNPHASQITAAWGAPPGVRPSQTSVLGISATDGISVVNPAINQYEVCFRCHGTSQGKGTLTSVNYGYLPIRAVAPGDPLDLVAQFAISSTSAHPVTHAIQAPLPQPSLRTQMLKLDNTIGSKLMTAQIFCTDCHNSDDNRESGGPGANGPHGSTWTHILERRYEMSQAPAPGQLISNLFPDPDFGTAGPYGLCAKCHDLDLLEQDSGSSFTKHYKHIKNFGISCSVCHTPHGMGGISPTISGERMVNFDLNVVAPNGTAPTTFSRSTKSCTLVCHGVAHTSDLHY